MNCRKCGEILNDNDKYCSVCGAPQKDNTSPLNPRHIHEEDCSYQGHPGEVNTVSFADAIRLYFTNYANFKGRSRRSEYWWIVLFNMIVTTAFTIILPDISGLWTLATFIPTLALCIRRLHDIGKSGWWYLCMFIPLVGGILMIIWFCKDSDPQTNPWGASTKY